MATAINFNWVIKEKLTVGKVYDFDFALFGCEDSPVACTMQFDGSNAVFNIGTDGRIVRVFRDKMRVIDAIAIAARRAGRVTSGDVYRANVLQEIRDDYAMREIYTDIYGPAHHFETNLPHKESTYFLGFELETAGRNCECETALHSLVSNIWRQVSDSSINGPDETAGIEFVSTFIHPEDAVKPAFYEDFCNLLTGLAVSGCLSSTGLHCHISREAFGDSEDEQNENIAKAVYMENYILTSDALVNVFGREPGGRWCRFTRCNFVDNLQVVAERAPRVMNERGVRDAMKEGLLVGNKCRCGHNYPDERYHLINVTNPATVEFRQGKGQIKSQALANIAQHVVTLAKYCRETQWSKLSARGYYNAIPNSAKYAQIKGYFNPTQDN